MYISELQINWLTAGNRDIWVQFDTNSKCHAILLHVSPFVTAPTGSAICIQLFGTAYEYSEQFFCIHGRAKQSRAEQTHSWHLLKDAERQPVFRELTVWGDGPHCAPVSLLHPGTRLSASWLTGPQHCSSQALTMFHICDEKLSLSSSPSSPPPSCSILICSYGSQPVAS